MEISQQQPQDNIKIALLGNPGVGKTCIINKYTKDEFSVENESTIGANYQQKLIKRGDKTFQLDLWDTAGQEKYRSLGRHFYKNAYIVIFVYDITVKKTFEDIKNVWYEDIKVFGEKYKIFAIAGNKSDLYEKEEVTEDEVSDYANEINASFFLVSAKSGNNISNLFDKVVDEYLGPEFQNRAGEVFEEKRKSMGGNVKLKKVNKNDENKKSCSC